VDTKTQNADAQAIARREKLRDLIRERRGTIANACVISGADPVWLRNIVYRTDPLKVDVETFMELARVCGIGPQTLYKKLRFDDHDGDESK